MSVVLLERTTLTPQERYQRAYRRLVRQRDALTDRQVRRLLGVLAAARRELLDQLGREPSDTLRAAQAMALRDAVDQAAERILTQATAALRDALTAAWEAGAVFAPDALRAAGLALPIRPLVDTRVLMVAQELGAELIRGVSADFRASARAVLTRGMLGNRSTWQLIQEIAGLLRTQPTRAHPRLGSITDQAERIVRTEMLGAFNLADDLQMRQVAEAIPEMRKFWDAVSDGRTRPAHAAAEARYRPSPIPLSEDFIVGGERASGPHDPRLSARNRINCRCVRALQHPDWRI